MVDIATPPKMSETILSYIDDAVANKQGAIPQQLLDEATKILSEKPDPQTGFKGPNKLEEHVEIIAREVKQIANTEAVNFQLTGVPKEGLIALVSQPVCKTADGLHKEFKLVLVAEAEQGKRPIVKPFAQPNPVDLATLPACDAPSK